MVRQEDLALFRGIAVLAETADQVRTNILQNGIRGDEGQWRFPISDLRHDVDRLLAKPDLSFVDTRPPEGSSESFPLICACGDELGASYYAVKHNTHSNVEETSYVIHFLFRHLAPTLMVETSCTHVFSFGTGRAVGLWRPKDAP